jgi:hypothetical protein
VAVVRSHCERPWTWRVATAGEEEEEEEEGITSPIAVRLCDGHHFPLEHVANAAPIETCGAMCPASKT